METVPQRISVQTNVLNANHQPQPPTANCSPVKLCW